MENKKSKLVLPYIYRILPHPPERGRCITHLRTGWGARQRVCRKSFLLSYLKGQCHEIFDFRFSIWISLPQAPDYTIRAISIFFETSWRYSQLKVHHRCCWHRLQMEKIFNQKICNISFGHPIHEKNQKQKISLDTVPLKADNKRVAIYLSLW